MKTVIFTKEGFAKILKEKEDIVAVRRAAVADLKKARDMGDLSENGYYKAARFNLSGIDRRIRELAYMVRFGKVEEAEKGNIGIGSLVTLATPTGEKKYTIVGEFEANPSEGKVSHVSPIGKLLLGKKNGDTIKLNDNTLVIKHIV